MKQGKYWSHFQLDTRYTTFSMSPLFLIVYGDKIAVDFHLSKMKFPDMFRESLGASF